MTAEALEEDINLLKVIGIDSVNGSLRSLIVDTTDERIAWQRAETKGIIPREIVVHPPQGQGERRKRDRRGIVYLLRVGVHFKIGKSIVPKQRYGQLSIQLPEKPDLVHEIVTNDVDYTERHWHRRFVAKRMNGEWFQLSEEEVDEFVQCKRMIVNVV